MEEQTADLEHAAARAVQELVEKLRHVLEPGIRRRVVRERLLGLRPAAAVAVIARVLAPGDMVARDDGGLREILYELLMASPDEAAVSLPYGFRKQAYAEAEVAGEDEVMRLLRSRGAGFEEGSRRLPPDLADIPLGRRRSLAKGEDAKLLELLALDPDPVVVRNLLRNARTREADVVRIAALRPVSGETLHEVARSERWSRNLKVRTALARNPFCPPDLAIKLLVALPSTVLREMRRDHDLHGATRAEVIQELERRG